MLAHGEILFDIKVGKATWAVYSGNSDFCTELFAKGWVSSTQYVFRRNSAIADLPAEVHAAR